MTYLTEAQLQSLERMVAASIPAGDREAATLNAIPALIAEVRQSRRIAQQSLLGLVYQWDCFHVAGSFASNDVVAMRLMDVDPVSSKLTELVQRYSDPAKLPVAHIRAILPAIKDLPPCLVFAPDGWDMDRLLEGTEAHCAGLHLVATELYELVTGKFNVDANFWSYRCLWDEVGGNTISALCVYDVDMKLVGFCCGLKVADHNLEDVKAVIRAALEGK